MKISPMIITSVMGLIMCACKPAGPAPDLIKTQGKMLDQAKGGEG